jgi:two-component system phosphate regulon sensor histidine kinase PhoR
MLDKILSSVSDGILLMDKEGKALLFNAAFKNMFPGAENERRFWEFLRSKEVECALKSVENAAPENAVSGEFDYKEKSFAFVISKVKNEDKFVVSVKDMTKFKQLDGLKKDFISNASHELKTPVTSIIGFSETLESGNLSAENRHYVEVIKKQAQRLSNIVKDLLSLSFLESKKNDDRKEFDIAALIENVAGFYLKKASEKGVALSTGIESGVGKIYGNEFNIEQLLINLTDNAVKYTENGEIAIKAENSGEFVRITVSDTGIGISKEHIPRLFERFYVVDKSRTRKSGGTGLGLSIVKHIVQSHNGNISIESEEGAGSKFIVDLPKSKIV